MDLISRKSVAKKMLYRRDYVGRPSDPDCIIADEPSIPAVPLDKLCEWLENDCILSCVSCEHLFGGQWCKQHPELPYRCNRKEHWKEVLTKRMEGLEHG